MTRPDDSDSRSREDNAHGSPSGEPSSYPEVSSGGDAAGRTFALEVPAADAGTRLDAWLLRQLVGSGVEISRSALQRAIKEPRVLVDGKKTKPSLSLRGGERVEVDLPPPPPPMPIPENLPLTVLHEDDAILVVSKPPDMVVHPSPGTDARGTLVNALLSYTDELSREGGDFRPGIVHRLDRETSGVILIARTDAAHRHIAAQFKARTVSKQYFACVHGRPKEREGEVDLPIARSLANRKKMAIRHDADGKASRTQWRHVANVGKDAAWIHCFPETGRTHQIRVHLKTIGHPILADAMYGREKKITVSEIMGRVPKPTERPVLERHALHAYSLEIEHPLTGERIVFRAPLPGDMSLLWALGRLL